MQQRFLRQKFGAPRHLRFHVVGSYVGLGFYNSNSMLRIFGSGMRFRIWAGSSQAEESKTSFGVYESTDDQGRCFLGLVTAGPWTPGVEIWSTP